MRLTCLALIVLLSSPAHVQPPSFDVATIKPSSPAAEGGGMDLAGSRLRATNITVQELIRAAYGDPGRWLPAAQIVGGPDWVRASRFDVQAAAADATPAAKLQMLRTLLTERFNLAIHRESRDTPIYALVVARPGALGAQMHRSDADCSAPSATTNRACTLRLGLGPSISLVAKGQPIAQLANALARMLNRPVVDRTGLAGGFDAEVTFAASGLDGFAATPGGFRPDGTSEAPSIFAAVQEQLGLKLEPTRGPVDHLVIDRIQPPTPD